MKLRKLDIKNFRGIKTLTWTLDAPFVCLVGPGDSTKTTILDALNMVLSSRYSLSFSDADFYQCKTDESIVIEAVVADLPDSILQEQHHGKNQSGVRADGSLVHDPVDEPDVEACLVIRLTVDRTLEPVWEVIRPGDADEVAGRISATERGSLGFFRLGDQAESHLRWSRGSALAGMTASKADATHAVIEAQRQARQAVAQLTGTPLHDAASLARTEAVKLGSAPFTELRPGLDPSFSGSTTSLVLHEGDVPITYYGLGTRRLTSLAIQENATVSQSIIAVDEIEHGLDPHRLAHLVRYLRRKANAGDLQVILTTHAPVVVESLSTDQLFIVRSNSGTTQVVPVPDDLGEVEKSRTQGMMRSGPSALLARRVIVGEGPTEVGFIQALLDAWDKGLNDADALTSVTAGVGITNGGGDTQAPARATCLAKLGYPTLLVIDGDVTTNGSVLSEAENAGVIVLKWPTGMALEDVLVEALSDEDLQKFVELAAEEVSEEAVKSQVAVRLGLPSLSTLNVSSWVQDHGVGVVRRAVASAAKGQKVNSAEKTEAKAWFKQQSRGETLGRLIFSCGSGLSREGAFIKQVGLIRSFAYFDGSQAAANGASQS